MSYRAILLLLLCLAALGTGLLAYPVFKDYYYSLGTLDSSIDVESYYNQRLRERFSDEQYRILAGTAQDYRELAEKYPDRPGYLWLWWNKDPSTRDFIGYNGSPAILSEQDTEKSRAADSFEKNLLFMIEKDPDNGYASYYLAYLEACKGIISEDRNQPETPLTIMNPENAEKAVVLLGEAVRKKRFTMYNRELGEEWLILLGGPPETFAETVFGRSQIARLPIPMFYISRDLVERLIAEAERRAAMPGEDLPGSVSAYQIFYDLQTLGARFVSSGPGVISPTVLGYSHILHSTEKGYEVLNAAGKNEDAERLLARGRRLSHLWLLARLMISIDPNTGDFKGDPGLLENDPELIAEAKRRIAARRDRIGPDEWRYISKQMRSMGAFAAMSLPNINFLYPWVSPIFTEAEAENAGRFETQAVQKLYWCAVVACCWMILAIAVVVYCIHALSIVKAPVSDWPNSCTVTSAVVRFGCLAVVPGIMAVAIGNFLVADPLSFYLWLGFWNIWGVVLALWTLRRAVRRFLARREGAEAPDIARGGWRCWIAPACFVLAAVCAGVAYFRPPGEISYFSFNKALSTMWIMAGVMVLLVALGLLWRLRCWIVRNCGDREERRRAAPGLRLFLAGLAGGLLLVLCSYWVIDRCERAWGRRDTLLVIRRPFDGWDEVGSKLDRKHVEYIEKALADEL